MNEMANTETRLPSRLDDLEKQAHMFVQGACLNLLQLGRVLTEARPLVPHGEWDNWCREHAKMSRRTAEQYVQAYNLCAGVLRSLGDSRTTLVAQVFGGLLNVVADWLFIAKLRLGVAGAAWATLLSQTVSAAYVVFRLTRLEGPHALRFNRVRFDRGILAETVRIGVPAGVQALVITLSNVAAQYHINRLGERAIAAFTAYFKVELIVYYPIVALGQAMMTFAGQNIGANQPERVRRGLRECLALGAGIAVLMSLVGLSFGRALFRLFYADEAAIALGLRILATTFPFYFTYCFLQIPGDAMRGVGESRRPMLIVIINLCLVRTALLFLIAPRWQDVRAVAACYPVTWAVTGACMLLCWRRMQKKRV